MAVLSAAVTLNETSVQHTVELKLSFKTNYHLANNLQSKMFVVKAPLKQQLLLHSPDETH